MTKYSRPTKTYAYNGQNYTLEDLAAITGLTRSGMRQRLQYHCGSVQDALRHPPKVRRFTFAGRTLTLREWSDLSGVPAKTIDARLRLRWTLEQALCIPSEHQRRRGIVSTPAADLHRLTDADQTPGVPSDREGKLGTGAGSVLRDSPNITFHVEEEIA